MTEVTYVVDGGIATITLNRPDARNRLNAAGMSQVASAFARAAEDSAVRVVVLTGSGSTFCSGADLSAPAGEGFSGAGPRALVDLLATMLDHPKPLIAKVQGHVAGGGNGLVAACDLAVASADARFAFSEVRLGVAPAVISVVCLAVMNRRPAQELLLTGERVDAHRVLAAGLLTSVVPAVGLDAAVQGLAEQLLAGGPEALAHTKELLRRVPTLARDEAFAFTSAMSAELFTSAEGQEGMAAFLEKRPAGWLAPS